MRLFLVPETGIVYLYLVLTLLNVSPKSALTVNVCSVVFRLHCASTCAFPRASTAMLLTKHRKSAKLPWHQNHGVDHKVNHGDGRGEPNSRKLLSSFLMNCSLLQRRIWRDFPPSANFSLKSSFLKAFAVSPSWSNFAFWKSRHKSQYSS